MPWLAAAGGAGAGAAGAASGLASSLGAAGTAGAASGAATGASLGSMLGGGASGQGLASLAAGGNLGAAQGAILGGQIGGPLGYAGGLVNAAQHPASLAWQSFVGGSGGAPSDAMAPESVIGGLMNYISPQPPPASAPFPMSAPSSSMAMPSSARPERPQPSYYLTPLGRVGVRPILPTVG